MPIKQNGYTHSKADAKLNRKRKEAVIRNQQYEVFSVKDKLATLPKTGAKKQRAKLEVLLAKEKEAAKEKRAVKKES